MSRTTPTPLYTAEEVRELDRLAIEHGIPGYELMQRAGQALADRVAAHWPQVQTVLVVCGAGNNAGDGYVAARLLDEAGYQVQIAWLSDPATLSGAARQAAEALSDTLVPVHFNVEQLVSAGLVIDALLGTGLARDVDGEWRTAIEAINDTDVPVLSADIPSGLDADTGAVRGVAVLASETVTFIGRKRGLYTGAGMRHAGVVSFADLEVPVAVYDVIEPTCTIIDAASVNSFLAPRCVDAHKGHFGHVLVVGGDTGMAGAVRLAAEAAARTGSGLVSVATRAAHAAIISATRAELMCHGVETVAQLQPLLARASVVVVGPGLGQNSWGRDMLMAVLQTDLPLVVDADALNLLAHEPLARGHWVITPHPGEAARLLACSTAEIQADRFAALAGLAERYQAVTVLKGAGSLVGAPGATVQLCDRGNPGMASGGMGDVLGGVIAGLVAQGLSLHEAAVTGVYVHARAADLAAEALGERGLLAGDVINRLQSVVNVSND